MEVQNIENLHHVVTIEDLGGLKRKVNIIFDNVGTKNALDKAVSLIKKNYQIKGHRKGKASDSVVYNMYRKQVQNIAKDILANDGFTNACIEQKLIPLSIPSIGEFSFNQDGSFNCFVLVDQKPTINPVGYVGMQLKKPETNREEIRDSILSKYKGELSVEVEKEVVEIGDTVVVDFNAKDSNGVEVSSGVDQKFAINPGMTAPFGENLIGLKRSEEFVVFDSVFPEEYPERAGEAIVVGIKVKNIFKIEQPTEEQMMSKLGMNNMEDFNKALEYSMNVEINKKERAEVEEQVIDKLLELNEFDVPGEWVEEEKKYFFKQINISQPDPQLLEYANTMAERNVKRTFILDSIYDSEPQLRISQEEIDAVIKQEAERRGVGSLILKEELKKNKMLDAVVGSIRNSKVMNFILSQVQFEESTHDHVGCNCEVPENPLG